MIKLVNFFGNGGGFTKQEMELLLEWLNDQELMIYSEQRLNYHTVISQFNYLAKMGPPNKYYKIYDDDCFVGTISAIIANPYGVADLGILIGKGFQRKGYGLAAWRLFLSLLSQQGIRKVEAGCMSDNTAMIRICELSHMKPEGTRKHHFTAGIGGTSDLILYGELL